MPGQFLLRSHRAMRDFLHSESVGGLILIGCVIFALLLANSPYAADYFGLLTTKFMGWNLPHFVNDGLMALFFFLVGLEIKREVMTGELSSWSSRILPLVAAVAGMAIPALVYLSFNYQTPENLKGWAIPAATDIAFALGIMALLGKSVPLALKTMLTAIAIIDDLGAVIIIALFYTSSLSLPMLGGAAAIYLVLLALNRLGCRMLWPYLLLGAVLWYCTYKSGVHATIAGVLLATTIPLNKISGEIEAPLYRAEHALHPWVAFLILPIFALVNAGLDLHGFGLENLAHPVTLGVMLGLFLGKQVGIFGAMWLAIKLGWAKMPKNCGWQHLYGLGLLCGVGFTMSLFIGLLAFPNPSNLAEATKIGVLAGSLLSALGGSMVLLLAPRKQKS